MSRINFKNAFRRVFFMFSLSSFHSLNTKTTPPPPTTKQLRSTLFFKSQVKFSRESRLFKSKTSDKENISAKHILE